MGKLGKKLVILGAHLGVVTKIIRGFESQIALDVKAAAHSSTFDRGQPPSNSPVTVKNEKPRRSLAKMEENSPRTVSLQKNVL